MKENNVVIAFNKGYRVLNDGRVSGLKNKFRILTLRDKNKHHYYCFTIKHNKKQYNIDVHKLQSYQKYGEESIKDGIQTRHLNGNSLDNSIDNIEIGSPSQNMMDKSPENRMRSAISASTTIRKFSDGVMKDIRQKRKEGWTYRELMDEYNISSKGTMSHIINHKYVTKV